MLISISQEMEALIHRRLKSGAFQTAQDVILDALVTQDLQEKWLEHNRDASVAEAAATSHLLHLLEARRQEWQSSKERAIEAALRRLEEEAFWRGVQQSYGEIAGSPQDVLVYQQEIADWMKTMHRS